MWLYFCSIYRYVDSVGVSNQKVLWYFSKSLFHDAIKTSPAYSVCFFTVYVHGCSASIVCVCKATENTLFEIILRSLPFNRIPLGSTWWCSQSRQAVLNGHFRYYMRQLHSLGDLSWSEKSCLGLISTRFNLWFSFYNHSTSWNWSETSCLGLISTRFNLWFSLYNHSTSWNT